MSEVYTFSSAAVVALVREYVGDDRWLQFIVTTYLPYICQHSESNNALWL